LGARSTNTFEFTAVREPHNRVQQVEAFFSQHRVARSPYFQQAIVKGLLEIMTFRCSIIIAYGWEPTSRQLIKRQPDFSDSSTEFRVNRVWTVATSLKARTPGWRSAALWRSVRLRGIIVVGEEKDRDLLVWHVAGVHCAMDMVARLVSVNLAR
jgi:hypothetical protein